MDCKQCAEDLTAFLDGELSAADSERVRSHLGSCPSCSHELGSLQETANFVETHTRTLELRPGSWNLVRARITTENAPAPSRFWIPNRWRLAMGALALAAVFGLGYLQYQRIQERNLDLYISNYIEQRETQMEAPQVMFSGTEENPYGNNPFVEIKASFNGNPFRSEGR